MAEVVDVAIVGYGPVGQTLAILLGQRGWRVAVLEKQPAPYPLPRAVHFDHEVARILQAAGLGEELPRLSEPADVYEWHTATGETLLRIGSREAGISGWPEANMFSQPALECALDARARALPGVDLRRACEVVDLRSGGDDVEVIATAPDGSRCQIRARYVVGCDGANSFVRRHLGTTVTDLGFFFDWLIIDVVPHEKRTWDPINAQLCDPARPTTAVSGGPGRRRWEFMRLPGERTADLDREDTAWRLLEPWALHRGNATLERHAVYTFQARWVDGWWKGRLILAGDAAHQMPPFAGQGMCAGIRDAANLAWKLDLVLAGRSADTLLGTYEAERIPQVRQVIDFSIELGRVICVVDPAEAARRDAAMIAQARDTGLMPPLPLPALGPGVQLDGDPCAGHLVPQGQVRRDGVVGRFDDVVGRGFILLSPVADPATLLTPDLATFFTGLGGTSAHVAADGPVHDLGGTYAKWFAKHGVDVVLQRPDFHVFGTARGLEGTTALVRRLRSALEGAPDTTP